MILRKSIDINADLGEFPERLADGAEAELMRFITSANIACGGHSGTAETMEQTLELARVLHVAAGAHPGYPDREGFGRVVMDLTPAELENSLTCQIQQLATIARRMKVPLLHVKPHGALYHRCNQDTETAKTLCRAVIATLPGAVLIGQAGSPCLNIYRSMGVGVAAEAFADRCYEEDGSLRSRSRPGALLSEAEAAEQAFIIATGGMLTTTSGKQIAITAETLCVHSDTPGSESLARAVRERITGAGIRVCALRP
jgi:UPF0271 protein